MGFEKKVEFESTHIKEEPCHAEFENNQVKEELVDDKCCKTYPYMFAEPVAEFDHRSELVGSASEFLGVFPKPKVVQFRL